MFSIRWTDDSAAFRCVQKVSASLNISNTVCVRVFHAPSFSVSRELLQSPVHNQTAGPSIISLKEKTGRGGCEPFNMVNHIQSSHMYQRLQSKLMNQLCLLTAIVRLSSGQLECAARPWPLQSRRCGRPLNLFFPLPLSLLSLFLSLSLSLALSLLSHLLASR